MIANFKKYVSMVLVVCMVIAVVCIAGCGKNKQPQETTPEITTKETTTEEKTTTPEQTTPESTNPESTTPEQTTTTAPTVTVTFPSDEDDDPKQEDVFFD